MADDNNIPKKSAKKTQPKRISFGTGVKIQIFLSSQENKEASFTLSLPLSSNVAILNRIASKESGPSRFCLYLDEVESSKLEPASLILPRRKQKVALSNKRPPFSKTQEIFSDQELIDYLSSVTNIVKYKNVCQYFHGCLAFIACNLSIDEPKSIFNATLFQFLEDNKKYN